MSVYQGYLGLVCEVDVKECDNFFYRSKTRCVRDIFVELDGLNIPSALGTLYYFTRKSSLVGRFAIVFLYL